MALSPAAAYGKAYSWRGRLLCRFRPDFVSIGSGRVRHGVTARTADRAPCQGFTRVFAGLQASQNRSDKREVGGSSPPRAPVIRRCTTETAKAYRRCAEPGRRSGAGASGSDNDLPWKTPRTVRPPVPPRSTPPGMDRRAGSGPRPPAGRAGPGDEPPTLPQPPACSRGEA